MTTAAAGVAVGTTGWAGFVRPPGATAPAFALRDQDGEPVSMAAYRGRPVVVTFVYSTCEDTCPALVDQVRGALDDTGLDVPMLAVSVDPANDTPSAREALPRRAADDRAARASCSARSAQLAPVWKGYGVQPQTGDLDHSAGVVLVDGRGAPARRLPVRPAHAGGARPRPRSGWRAAAPSAA